MASPTTTQRPAWGWRQGQGDLTFQNYLKILTKLITFRPNLRQAWLSLVELFEKKCLCNSVHPTASYLTLKPINFASKSRKYIV